MLGCGGIGNLVAVTLATSGIGKLTLVDADRVELSNLTRQFLFTEADLGELKCTVLAREVTRRNAQVDVSAHARHVSHADDLAQLPIADLVVVSADSFGLTDMVNAYCVSTGQAWLNICYVNDIAVWGPLVVPGVTGCWDCRRLVARAPADDSELATLMTRVNRRYQAPSNGPVNMLASSLAGLDVLRFLGGFGAPRALNRRVGLWTHDLAVDGQEVPRSRECATCGDEAMVRGQRSG
jgi:molybdopterin-synthase adenylyltransferase